MHWLSVCSENKETPDRLIISTNIQKGSQFPFPIYTIYCWHNTLSFQVFFACWFVFIHTLSFSFSCNCFYCCGMGNFNCFPYRIICYNMYFLYICVVLYRNIPQYPLTASNDWSGGATRSKSRGNWDRQLIAANRFGSPGPWGSGSSREFNTEPDTDNRNWGRDDISYKDGSKQTRGNETQTTKRFVNIPNTRRFTQWLNSHTCGRIQTIGFLRDNDFVLAFVGKSMSSCNPPRDIIPLLVRILFGNVPFEMASIERGRDNVDKWSICPFMCVPPFCHCRIFRPPSSTNESQMQPKPRT